jgi:hypothetical protein
MMSAGCLSLFSQCQIIIFLFFPWKWRLHTGERSLPRDWEIVNKQAKNNNYLKNYKAEEAESSKPNNELTEQRSRVCEGDQNCCACVLPNTRSLCHQISSPSSILSLRLLREVRNVKCNERLVIQWAGVAADGVARRLQTGRGRPCRHRCCEAADGHKISRPDQRSHV